MRLLRGDGPLLKIGHRGAAALAPANTIEAAEAALVQGVDLIELDVFGGPDGQLVLSHSRRELSEQPVTLEKLGRSVEARPHWREYRALAPEGEFVDLAKEFSD